jgi:hypothetical protein
VDSPLDDPLPRLRVGLVMHAMHEDREGEAPAELNVDGEMRFVFQVNQTRMFRFGRSLTLPCRKRRADTSPTRLF